MLMDVNRMLTGRKILEVELDPKAVHPVVEDRSAYAFTLCVPDLDSVLGSCRRLKLYTRDHQSG